MYFEYSTCNVIAEQPMRRRQRMSVKESVQRGGGGDSVGIRTAELKLIRFLRWFLDILVSQWFLMFKRIHITYL